MKNGAPGWWMGLLALLFLAACQPGPERAADNRPSDAQQEPKRITMAMFGNRRRWSTRSAATSREATRWNGW